MIELELVLELGTVSRRSQLLKVLLVPKIVIELELELELGIYLDSQLDRTCWGYRLGPPIDNDNDDDYKDDLGREVVAPWSAGCDVDSPSLTAQMHEAAQNARGSNPLPEGQGTPVIPLRILVPLIVACALFMENLDATVLSTALPAIAHDLHQSPIQLKLALTSYLLTLAVFIPASGWVADRFGTRIVFRLAILIFAIGSALCGFANSIETLVAARAFQGIGGAMMVPVGRLVILRTIPRSELVGALAWLTMPALLGPVMGPPVGGFITTYFHWRWIFWINLPMAALGMTLATLFIPNVRGETVTRFDYLGFVLSGVGLAGLVSASAALGRFRSATLDCRRPFRARCHFGEPLCSARSPSGIAYSGFETLEISNLQGRNCRRLTFSNWCRSDAFIAAAAASARFRDDSA